MNNLKLSLLMVMVFSSALTFSAQSEEKVHHELKMVVTAAVVSERGVGVYKDLANYLSERLGWDVRVVSGLSYEQADAMLKKGVIQIGFVCGLPFVQQSQGSNYELLATPVMATKAGEYKDAKGYEDIPGKYYSYTIVHKDADIQSWQDLKGKTYAFNDVLSNSGYNMPRYKLVMMGVKRWEDYFSKVIVSGSHEESIRLVARGMVDASSVDSLVLDFDRHIGNLDALNVKIIEHLHPGGAGAPPIVAGKNVSDEIKLAIKQELLVMHETEQGRRVLQKALISHFVSAKDENYDDIRYMENAAKEQGFVDYDAF